MSKKKFKDTKIGGILSKLAPGVLDVAGDLLPDAGVLGVVKNLIDKDESIPPQDKEMLHNFCVFEFLFTHDLFFL